MEEKKKPVHEIPLGLVKATLWANQTNGEGVRYRASLSCRYKAGDQWKECTSYTPVELALISKACDMAATWILQQETKATSSRVSE